MTNILDTVEPTLWGHKALDTLIISNTPHAHLENVALYSRETLEPAIERLLAEHRKQVLLEVAKFCDTQYERDKSNQEASGQDNSDGYVSGYIDGAGDCGHGLRRMAEGEK
jgi:hypothetical protein